MSGISNFGIGLGAAVSAFREGIQIGREIKGLRREQEIEKVTSDGINEAKTQRQSQINGLIQEQPLGGGASSFKVGDQSFSNRQDAEREAEKHVGSTIDYFNKNIAPRIREAYIGQGNMAMAEQWDKYSQSDATKRGMRAYAKALRARAMGDDESALKHMIEAYNDADYYGDGYRMSGYEPIKDKDGKVIGYQGKFVGPDGKETTQDFRKGDLSTLVNLGIGMLSPDQAFAATMQQVQAADKARIEAAGKRLENSEKLAADVFKDNNQSANRRAEAGVNFGYDSQLQRQRDDASMDRTVTGIQMGTAAEGQKAGARVSGEAAALRGLGVGEDEVRAAATRSVGGRTAAEKDVGAAAWDAEQRNNPVFSTMSDEERQREVTRGIRGRQAASEAAAAAGGANAGTIPAQVAPGGGVEVIDPATGQRKIIR